MAPSSRADKYHIAELLGKGSFGTAHVVIDKETRKKHVLKRIRLARLNEWQRQSSFQEMDLVSALSHPFVVPYIDGWVHHGHTIYIVYGYCSKGDLGDLLQCRKEESFGEDQLKKWLAQILLAMEYMHKQGVIHRDIKSGNLFLTGNGNINIGDFGLATVRDSTNEPDYSVVGTPHYMSPELLSRKTYDFTTDIWSIGCVMYELTALKTAFNAFNIHGLIHKIKKTTVAPLPSQYSSDWCQLVRSMLRKSPSKRPSVMDLLNCPCMLEAVHDAMETARKFNPKVTLPKLSPCVPLYWRQLSGPYGVRGYGVTQSTSKDRSRFGRPSNTPRSDPPLSQRGRIGAPLIERSMQDADDVPSRIQVDSNRQGFGLKPHEENERDPNSEGYQSTGSSTHGNGSDPKQELTPLDRSDSSGDDRGGGTERGERSSDPTYAMTHRSVISDPGAFLPYNTGQDTDRILDEPSTDRPKHTSEDNYVTLRRKGRSLDQLTSPFTDLGTDRSERGGSRDEGLGVIPESEVADMGPSTSRLPSARKHVFATPRSDVSQTPTPRDTLARLDSARLSALICSGSQVDTQKRWEVLEQAMTLCAELHRRGRWEELGHILNNLSRGPGAQSLQDPSTYPCGRDPEDVNPFLLGDSVVIGTSKQCHGVIRYYGPVAFSHGDFVGLELDAPDGKNNGTVNGIPYFSCSEMCGLFVRASMLRPEG